MRRPKRATMLDIISIFLLVMLMAMADTVIGVPVAQNNGIEAFDKSVDIETLALSTDDRFTRLYSEMITVLERLNILPRLSNSSLCMGLEKVQRQVKSPDSSDSLKQVAVVLYFKEASLQEVVSDRTKGTVGQVGPICKYSSSRAIHGGLASQSLKEGNGNFSKPKTQSNITSALGGTDPKTKGLSKTQIAVIVTCAVVLGSFFIIAGILRIRSCLNRYRLSRESAVGVTRRTSNIGVNGSGLSVGNLRRDSSTSKASRQSNPSFKDGSDLQINKSSRTPSSVPPNSSPVHNSDHKPLLPARSVKQGSETGSSHGSLAFIDDESHSKIKDEQMDENDSELESEDDPLLRKSPDSGSSIEVTMADVYNVDNASIESDKQPLEQPNDDQTPDVNGVDETNDWQSGRCATVESQESMSVEDEVPPLKRNSFAETDEVPPLKRNSFAETDEVPPLKRNSFAETDPYNDATNRRESLPRQDSYAFDVNEWQFGNNIFDWPKEDSEISQNIANSYAVNIGLSQSNSSISNNPSYCYGNQTEYVYKGGYGNVGYRSPHEPIYLDNCRFTDTCECDDKELKGNNSGTCDNGNGLCIVDNVNQIDSISPSDISSGSLSISKDSSGEPLLSHNHQHLRTPSNGTNRISGADNLALTDSGDDEPCTGGSQCTVVSQIVPLAVYHRNSMC